MAIYHLNLSHGSRGGGQSAKAKLDYISRSEKYSYHSDRCLGLSSMNLPAWAKSAEHFWKAADENERANGRLFSEIRVALPIELNLNQQTALVKDFARTILPEQPLTFAIHDGKGENPHCHLMFSERISSNVPEEVFFKRNGAKKNRNLKASSWLENTREKWADMTNQALRDNATLLERMTGKVQSIDHRSLKDQGIDRKPQKHMGNTRSAIINKNIEGRNGEKNGSNSQRQANRRRVEQAKSSIRRSYPELQRKIRRNKREPRKEDQSLNRRKQHIAKLHKQLEFDSKQADRRNRETLQGTERSIEPAIAAGCQLAFESLRQQRERDVQRSRKLRQRIRDIAEQSERSKRDIDQTRRNSKLNSRHIRVERGGRSAAAVRERVGKNRAIDALSRNIDKLAKRLQGAYKFVAKCITDTIGRINAVGYCPKDKNTAQHVTQKLRNVDRGWVCPIYHRLQGETQLEPAEGLKMPQKALKRNSTQLTTKSIVLTKSQNYIEEKLEAEEARRIQETIRQKKEEMEQGRDRGRGWRM